MEVLQGRFSYCFPADRTKRKRVLQTIFNKLRSETFRERRAILKRLYRVECIKETTTGRILNVGPTIDDSEDIVRALLRAHLLPGFYYVENVYEKIERILRVGPDTEDDPEDIVGAYRLEYLLPVAKLANIPTEKTVEFLRKVNWEFDDFKFESNVDAERRKFEAAIRQAETASNSLLRALEYLDNSKGKGHLETRFATQLQDDPKTRWPESQWYLYLAAAQSSVEIAEAKAKQAAIDDSESQVEAPLDDCKRLIEAPLDDFRRRVEALKQAAKRLSTRRIPKRNNKHTKKLIIDILKTVDECGGDLTYNKNKHTGTLAEVYEFFRARAPTGTWTKLSPATLQRLKDNRS
jgi:hypothetical protein